MHCFSVKLDDRKKDLSKKNVQFLEMSSESRQRIIDSLTSEFGPGFAPALDGVFEFQVSDLFLEDDVTHTRGKLETALDSLFPGRGYFRSRLSTGRYWGRLLRGITIVKTLTHTKDTWRRSL